MNSFTEPPPPLPRIIQTISNPIQQKLKYTCVSEAKNHEFFNPFFHLTLSRPQELVQINTIRPHAKQERNS